jgi:hypothetical protein
MSSNINNDNDDNHKTNKANEYTYTYWEIITSVSVEAIYMHSFIQHF